jgi:deazaflavin-dependent oxidoreductase (nitroreductase family)
MPVLIFRAEIYVIISPESRRALFSIEHIRQLIFQVAASHPGMRLFYLFVKLIDMPISIITKGRFIPSAHANILPIFYLTTIGAKSKKPRSTPVLCIPVGEVFILVGSNWGRPQHPSWVFNLRANPRAQIRKGHFQKTFIATEQHNPNREAYWQKAIKFYPPYAAYEQRSGRLLPVFLLEAETADN